LAQTEYRSACGIAYLGVLKAVDEFLLQKGHSEKQLAKKIEEYQKALKRYASMQNGKLVREFNDIYEELHIAGYDRRFLHSIDVVKAPVKRAELFIRKLR